MDLYLYSKANTCEIANTKKSNFKFNLNQKLNDPKKGLWACVYSRNLSMVRQSWWVDSFILFWASQCSMFVAGTPSIARMTSPGHRLAADALLPGVIWMGVNKQGEHHRQVDNKKTLPNKPYRTFLYVLPWTSIFAVPTKACRV